MESMRIVFVFKAPMALKFRREVGPLDIYPQIIKVLIPHYSGHAGAVFATIVPRGVALVLNGVGATTPSAFASLVLTPHRICRLVAPASLIPRGADRVQEVASVAWLEEEEEGVGWRRWILG